MKNAYSEQHPYNCSSDYTVLIHHNARDHHVKWYNYKGRQYLCKLHNFATHAWPFGLPCSKAMSVHTRLANYNLSVFAWHIHGLYPRCMWTSICLPPIIMWGSITKNFLGDCNTKGEHNSLEFVIRDFLDLCYHRVSNTSTSKNSHNNIKCKYAWYDMVSSSMCLISIEPPAWSPSVHRCGAKSTAPVVKPPDVQRYLPFNHITSHAPQ
jgi:hypothetical protein